MAKTLMPLASAKARGAIHKMLVFFNWKGLNVVRGYVIPANPNTAAQQTQRGYMTTAVGSWHTTGYDEDDRTAWNLWATTLAKPMSGFNAMVKQEVEGLVAAKTPVRFFDVNWTPTAAATATVDIDSTSALAQASIRYGTSKSFMPNSQISEGAGAQQTFDLVGLSDLVTYYYQIYTAVGAESGNSGVYKVKHIAP